MTIEILITGDSIAMARLDALRARYPEINFRYFVDSADLEACVEEADAVAGYLSPQAFRRALKLQWVHSWAAGPDRALYPEMVESPVPLTSAAGNGAIPLAEHALMLMLMLSRQAPRWFESQQQHRWERFTHAELHGQSCGIIGLGHSGVALARMAKGLDMVTLGVRRTSEPAAYVDELHPLEDLESFLGRSDFVVVTAPLTVATRNMLGEREFRWMKPSAFYICFSRGGIANDAALLRALREGWIAGAGLDAHEVEPLPPDSPFWDAPNTIITPHNAATSPQTLERGFDVFEENVRRFIEGEPLINLVDKVAGY